MPPFSGQKQSPSSGSSGTLQTRFLRFPWDSPSEYGTASCQLLQLKSYLTAAFCLKQRNTLLFVWYQFYLLRQPRQFSVWARQALPPAAQGTCKSSPVFQHHPLTNFTLHIITDLLQPPKALPIIFSHEFSLASLTVNALEQLLQLRVCWCESPVNHEL